MNLGRPYVCSKTIFRGFVDIGKEEADFGLRTRLVGMGYYKPRISHPDKTSN